MGEQVVIPRGDTDNATNDGNDDGMKKDGAYWSQQLVVPSRRRQVSRFWLEKALVLTDGVQIFALMWQLSQPWPWPARWLQSTRWANAFTLDFFSFGATGAAMGSTSQQFSLWGERHNYWLYALVWALVPWSGVLALQLAKRMWTRQGRSDFLLLSVTWENVLLQILQFLYIPVGLAVLRLVNCNANGLVSVDPTGVSCGSTGHVAVVVIVTCGMGGSFLVGLPWMLRRRIRESLVHSKVEKHERFMQAKELEFMLGTSDTYLELYMPQFASFRRRSVEMPVQACILKLALMLNFSILRSPPPSISNQGMQGSLFFFAMVGLAVYRTWRYPYRCVSTSYIAILVDWMLVTNGVFVLLCANGVRSALTVSTYVTSSLTFLNACFVAVIGVMVLHDGALAMLHHHTANSKRLCWPTNDRMKEIVDNGPKVASWVKAINNAQSAILAALLVIPSMRSYEDLKTSLDEVELCYDEAAGIDHLLMGQLYEVSLYVHELYVEAVASSPFHRSGFPAKELADLTGVLQRRKDRQILLSTRSQRVSKKLNIAKSWTQRSRQYASTNDEWRRKPSGIQSFLDAEFNYQYPDLVVAMDWKTVNSVVCLKCYDDSESRLLVNVIAWCESLDLVKWCAMDDPSCAENSQERYFSMTNARHAGIQGGVVSCGDASNTAAILQALAAPFPDPSCSQ